MFRYKSKSAKIKYTVSVCIKQYFSLINPCLGWTILQEWLLFFLSQLMVCGAHGQSGLRALPHVMKERWLELVSVKGHSTEDYLAKG